MLRKALTAKRFNFLSTTVRNVKICKPILFKRSLFDNHHNHSDFLKVGGPIGSLLAAIYGWYLTKKTWTTREFHRRVLLSLNTLNEGKLLCRTLFEKDLEEILLKNNHACGIVLNAMKKTTEGKPFITLPDDERWHIMNLFLNSISEICPQGYLARDMGIPSKTVWYIFGLTCEKEAKFVKQQKLRVMLIKQKTLEDISEGKCIQYEQPHHVVRKSTLVEMARIYKEQKQGGPQILVEIEICFPLYNVEKLFPTWRSQEINT